MSTATETKSLVIQLKADDAPEGAFTATFSTLNVVDHQGDVTLPGAFEDGVEVLAGAYGHDTWQLPVGKGVIHADAERAWFDGQFNLNTTSGRDTYEAVKDAGALMEWSYIFRVTKSSEGEFDIGDGKMQDVRFLEGIEVWSVDPVLKGAGIGTGTDEIKARGGDCDGCAGRKGDSLSALLNRLIDAAAGDGDRIDVIERMASAAGISASTVQQIVSGSIDCPPQARLTSFARVLDATAATLIAAAERDGCYSDDASRSPINFADQATAVISGVAEFTVRAEARTAMRAKDGRRISADGRAQIDELVTRLGELRARLEDVLREPASENATDVEQTYLAFMETSSRLLATV